MVWIRREKMKYDWKEAGEEWSQPWGSSAAQWTGTIFPRIRECLPADTILEIAPGFGRWTHYLKDYCNELWAVDKSSDCIEACRQRFASVSHVRCVLNDGRSLSMIPDASVDFVFSFDSFVHPDRDVVEAVQPLPTGDQLQAAAAHSSAAERTQRVQPRYRPAMETKRGGTVGRKS